MIVTDCQSFSVHYDKGFRRVSHALNINYKFLLQNVTEKHFPQLPSARQRGARFSGKLNVNTDLTANVRCSNSQNEMAGMATGWC